MRGVRRVFQVSSGGDRGVNAVVILLPNSKQGLIVLTNGDNGFRLYHRLVVDLLDLGEEIMNRAK